MSKLIYAVLLIAFSGFEARAQFPAGFGWVFPRESPPASITQTVGVTDITIRYHRPMTKARKLWGCQTTDVVPKPTAYGCLVPEGQVWRAGANDATTITFSTAVLVEGVPLPAGTYGLFMIPGEQDWTIIFSRRSRQWGSFAYNEAEDAARVKVKTQNAEHQERLEYSFPEVSNDDAMVSLRWEKKKVSFKISVETPKLASAKARTSFDPASGYFAAEYYYQKKTNLDEALKWINAALAFSDAGTYLMLKARILAELKQFNEAVQVAGQAAKGFRAKGQSKPAEEAEKLFTEWAKLNRDHKQP